jgi:predicted aspartyl protease
VGITYVEMEVGNVANPRVTEKLEFLVDSGAVYSVVPGRILRKSGVKPVDTKTFILANGDKISRKKGVALFKYGKRVGGSDVVFGEKGDALLLGALTLESLGLSLDPLKRELRELPMILA